MAGRLWDFFRSQSNAEQVRVSSLIGRSYKRIVPRRVSGDRQRYGIAPDERYFRMTSAVIHFLRTAPLGLARFAAPDPRVARLVSPHVLALGWLRVSFGTGRKKRVDLGEVKTLAVTNPAVSVPEKATMEQKRQNRNRPVFTSPAVCKLVCAFLIGDYHDPIDESVLLRRCRTRCAGLRRERGRRELSSARPRHAHRRGDGARRPGHFQLRDGRPVTLLWRTPTAIVGVIAGRIIYRFSAACGLTASR